MAVQGGEDVYASLLLTDAYLPGALVLAHSLRDAGTTKKLAILVTLDSVSVDVITQLKAVYDYVIPVSRIRNDRPANLYLMNRPDLHSAFTKINLWKQTQFRKIVYVDADVVAYRAPDELFDLPHAFSAAPDIGWPDLFNTGVMALTPNLGEYYALMAMAERGISFDGADQGLLNMHFKNTFNRLSFTYNVTPSAHYQYVPAYKHFQSSINMVHFIGPDKPWVQGRDKSTGGSPFDEIVGRWWAVYDRHYRREASPSQPEKRTPEIVQYFVKGEFQPTIQYVVPVGEPPHDSSSNFYGQHYQPSSAPSHGDVQYTQQQFTHQSYPQPEQHHQHQDHHVYHHHEPQHHEPQQHHHHEPQQHPHYPSSAPSHPESSTERSVLPPSAPSVPSVPCRSAEWTHTEAREDQATDRQKWGPQPEPQAEQKPERKPDTPPWDAQRQPPPPDSKPEALNFPQTHYAMSSDPAPFVPPERYPSPPKNMWYEVPKEAPAHLKEKPKAIFPWETSQPRPTRVFPHQEPQQQPEVSAPEPAGPGETKTSTGPSGPAMSASPTAEQASEPKTPPQHGPASRTAISAVDAPDIWSSFPRSNAWDDVPEINRYVDAMQKHHRRTRSRGALALTPGGRGGGPYGELELGSSGWSSGGGGGGNAAVGRRGSKVTDFPSEDDRPSLPVTPAPIRRPRYRWGGGGPGLDAAFFGEGGEEGQQLLPDAEGVPAQPDWVCVHGVWWRRQDCLCDLTNVLRYYKDPVAQLQKLAREQSEGLFERLGGGVAVAGEEGEEGEGRRDIPSRSLPFGSEDITSPTYVAYRPAPVVSPKPVKPDTGTSPVNRILAEAPEIMSASQSQQGTHGYYGGRAIPAPSYQGPGAAFEKGEDVPAYETPALPTEEERDVLET